MDSDIMLEISLGSRRLWQVWKLTLILDIEIDGRSRAGQKSDNRRCFPQTPTHYVSVGWKTSKKRGERKDKKSV